MATDSDDATLNVGITCYPTYGGSGVIATEVGLALARRGHHVHFIAAAIPHRLDHFVDNVFFHAVAAIDYPLLDHSPYAIALASKMVEVSTSARLDVLHVHYAVPHATSAYLARQVLGDRAPRIVTTLHGTDITLVGSDPSYLPITRFSILQSDGVTVPSRYLRQATYDYLSIPTAMPIEVIPNFVDTTHYRPARPRPDVARALFPSAPPGPLLVHASNLRPLKRVDDVVRILHAVRRAVPARLILVGDGPERPRVEALAHELGLDSAVCFLGQQLDFVPVLQAADVFLLPSQSESFGLAALEALACGVPVVASRIGGVPEVVDDGETGFLCEPGDVEQMAAATVRLLTDGNLRERMAIAARRAVEDRFAQPPLVDRYEAYLRAIATKTR